MNPLAVFPELLTFSLLGPFLLRIAVGLVIILFGKERYGKNYKWTSIIYFVTGAMLVTGLFTQIVVIAGLLLLRFDMWAERKSAPVPRIYIISDLIMSVILISLLFTGPGFFAFDMPL